MTADQRERQAELHDLALRYQWLRVLFQVQRDRLVDQVQAATREMEEVDVQILRVHELQRDLAAEVERTEGVA